MLDGSGSPLTSDTMLMPMTSDSDTDTTVRMISAASDEIIPSTDFFMGDKIPTQAGNEDLRSTITLVNIFATS